MDDDVEDEIFRGGILDEERMPENIFIGAGSNWDGPTHDDVYRTFQEGLKYDEEEILRRFISFRCKMLVSVLFAKTHERAGESVHTPFFNSMKQPAINALFPGASNELFDDKMYELGKF